ncbi:hypothetical protein PHMEG_0007089 [Phytophthora megakarya]|uniref:Uncharacterized protein n=1 Tax=Phytophthora megakarya TaxID=4795 RepID=A0A225WME9_9STRA|nr:hypothetical protein PHMEG_0007089 [Phytophthora megakarya]
MEFNWGDPKKNSLLSSRMMAKAEITRKKRLTSVKSTVSNQLHPAIEHKLRSRFCNYTHDTHQFKEEPQMVSDDESSTLDTVRHATLSVPTRASCSDNESMFDEFGLNAAADGLFHPASSIEAFTEHDAKYQQEIKSTEVKPRSGPRRARCGSEYPPSRENHRLPVLHSGKSKRDRMSARSESKFQSTNNSGSAPASMVSAASLSKLMGVDEEEKRGLTANQSDSNLYAPRRADTVPSSADRNALDFFEGELEKDDNNNDSSIMKSSRGISELDNNAIPEESSYVVPVLDISLARKFAELKQIMKSNREKHNSARQNNEQTGTEVASNKFGTGQPTHSSPKKRVQPRKSSRNGQRNAIHTSSSGSGDIAPKTKGVSKKRSIPAARVTIDMKKGPSGPKRTPTNHSSTRKSSYGVVVAKTPSVRSKKEIKMHNGTSLSDLKAEHREALQMLKELGGPMDPDYLYGGVDTKVHERGRSITRTTIVNQHTGPTVAVGGLTSSNQLQDVLPPSPPNSANSGARMVTKLRESVSSGRISTECSPRTSSPGSPTVSSGRSEKVTNFVPVSTGGSDNSNQTEMRETPSNATTTPDRLVPGAIQQPSLSPDRIIDSRWKRYQEDITEDEGENNNQLEHVQTTHTSGERYNDEDFENDW